MEARAISIHADLIERAIQNDREAQFDLYKKYNAAMYNTALRITGNTAVAEDVIQEAFLSAFQSLVFFRGESSFGSWLKRIVINKAITHARKESKWELTSDENTLDRADEDENLPDDLEVAKVKRAMEELPDGFRTVLSLYLIEGYDHKEIAEILSISESTSKTQYKRAKDKLRSILNEE